MGERGISISDAGRAVTQATNIEILGHDGKLYTYNFAGHVASDPIKLAAEALEVSGMRHFAGNLLADAQKRLDIHKITMDRYCSQLRLKFSQEARANGEKLTIRDLDDLVNTDETHYQLQAQLISLEEVVSRLSTVIKSLEIKKDMLQTISANLRSTEGGLSDIAISTLASASEALAIKRRFQ